MNRFPGIIHKSLRFGENYFFSILVSFRNFRVEFLNEAPDEVVRTITKYRQLLRGEISGTQLRAMFSNGEKIPAEFSRPEVVAVLQEYYSGLK